GAAMTGHLLRADAPIDLPAASEKLVRLPVCRLTGLLPCAASRETVDEWFLAGTEPRSDASAWFENGADGQSRLALPAEYAAWTRTANNALGAQQRSGQRLTIAHPCNGAAFVIEPSLPRSQQMIEFACSGAASPRWFVNGEEIAPKKPDGRTFWPLAPGDWRVCVRADGQSAEVSIRVE